MHDVDAQTNRAVAKIGTYILTERFQFVLRKILTPLYFFNPLVKLYSHDFKSREGSSDTFSPRAGTIERDNYNMPLLKLKPCEMHSVSE